MGPVTFRDSVLKESEGTMVLTMEQARFYLETYKELFPEIVVWQIEIEDTIRRTRLLRNAFGYPRRFERIITDSYLREAISWKPQSTIGVITHKAFVATRNHIVKYGLRWRPISNKHDSYALMIPEPDVEQAREEEAAGRAGNEDVPVEGSRTISVDPAAPDFVARAIIADRRGHAYGDHVLARTQRVESLGFAAEGILVVVRGLDGKTDAALGLVDLDDAGFHFLTDLEGVLDLVDTVLADLRDVHEAVDVVLELNEGAE